MIWLKVIDTVAVIAMPPVISWFSSHTYNTIVVIYFLPCNGIASSQLL